MPSGGYLMPVSKRVLVVTTAEVDTTKVDAVVRAHAGGDAEIHVVAPASKVSRLDFLTNAEDDARADAANRAEATAESLSNGDAHAHVGDVDPVQAIADALREFPADEVILLTAPDEDATWLESDLGARAKERFAVPLTHLTA
jgi:hypothetical protein